MPYEKKAVTINPILCVHLARELRLWVREYAQANGLTEPAVLRLAVAQMKEREGGK